MAGPTPGPLRWQRRRPSTPSHRRREKKAHARPELSAELSRLQRADAEHLTGLRSIHAVARKELSHDAFPATQRFWEVSTLGIRPGGEAAFEAAAKAYGAAAARSAPDTAYRVYEVAAGMPSPTYLAFGSVNSFAAFDDVMKSNLAIMKALNPQEQEAMEKFTQVMIRGETNRFRLDPGNELCAERRQGEGSCLLDAEEITKL